MYTEDEQAKRTQNPQFAAIDAKRYNAKYEGLYTSDQKGRAQDIRCLLDNAYFGAKVYPPNYRAKFIAIKVEKPGQNQYRSAVRKTNKELEELGVVIKKTAANSFIYQLPEAI